MAIDPVCGMTVKPDSPHHFEYRNVEYHFCNAKCVVKFQASPETYLNPRPVEAVVAKPGVMYICPDGSGSAPAHAGQLPQVRHGAGSRISACGCG